MSHMGYPSPYIILNILMLNLIRTRHSLLFVRRRLGNFLNLPPIPYDNYALGLEVLKPSLAMTKHFLLSEIKKHTNHCIRSLMNYTVSF